MDIVLTFKAYSSRDTKKKISGNDSHYRVSKRGWLTRVRAIIKKQKRRI